MEVCGNWHIQYILTVLLRLLTTTTTYLYVLLLTRGLVAERKGVHVNTITPFLIGAKQRRRRKRKGREGKGIDKK